MTSYDGATVNQFCRNDQKIWTPDYNASTKIVIYYTSEKIPTIATPIVQLTKDSI